jgi:hypothetical protein
MFDGNIKPGFFFLGGGSDPAGMMIGMAVGSLIGRQMTNTLNNMCAGFTQPLPSHPQPLSYHVVVNSQVTGPYDINALKQMTQTGLLTRQSFVWKTGMVDWAIAETFPELGSIFC